MSVVRGRQPGADVEELTPASPAKLSSGQPWIDSLKRLGQVRLEPERLPDPAHAGLGQSRALRYRRPRPMRGSFGVDSSVATTTSSTCSSVIFLGAPPGGPRQRVPPAGAAGTGPPLSHRGPRHPQQTSNLHIGQTVSARQNDPAPLRQCLGAFRSPRPPLQRLTLLIGQCQFHLRATTTGHASKYAPCRSRSQIDTIS
jgi:hypothetical protein